LTFSSAAQNGNFYLQGCDFAHVTDLVAVDVVEQRGEKTGPGVARNVHGTECGKHLSAGMADNRHRGLDGLEELKNGDK
jgi:hypothetical protein